jgi:catechol 2,3-dioxygenase-like lactoylglutathione lyase family enzyme
MRVEGIAWLGVRTSRFEEMTDLYRVLTGLQPYVHDSESSRFRLDDGTEIHVYGPTDEWHEFFGTAPVVGLLVDDADGARAELETAGIGILTDTQRDDTGSWFHFRGPDGNVYELISRTRPA